MTMLNFLRLYYNYFLVKWKIRKVLPAYFINKVTVKDCGEELVQYQGVWVRKRLILYNAMTQAGFVNYPLEWWHFCYGDKMYAAYKFEKQAIYGKATLPWQVDLFKTE